MTRTYDGGGAVDPDDEVRVAGSGRAQRHAVRPTGVAQRHRDRSQGQRRGDSRSVDEGPGRRSVRLDWGPAGAAACDADVADVVDVLSFSTAVTVAVERGARVYPSLWSDDRARAVAATHDAVLALGRGAAAAGGRVAPSLSPAALLASRLPARLVLPSPNGSAISASLSSTRSRVVAGCLRNAAAVAATLAVALDEGLEVAVIAAGERWSHDGSLRPALEDHLGAGAILASLRHAGYVDRLSPEAEAAASLFDASTTSLSRLLHECVSGRELAGQGFADDVAVAADLDAVTTVPMLVDGAFVDTHGRPGAAAGDV